MPWRPLCDLARGHNAFCALFFTPSVSALPSVVPVRTTGRGSSAGRRAWSGAAVSGLRGVTRCVEATNGSPRSPIVRPRRQGSVVCMRFAERRVNWAQRRPSQRTKRERMRKLRPLWTRWGRARRRSPQTAKWGWTRRRRRERSKWGRVRGRRRQRTRRSRVRRQLARPRRPPQQCARGQRLRPLRQLRRSHFRVSPSLSALKCHGGQVQRRRGGQLRCRPHQAGQIPPNSHH